MIKTNDQTSLKTRQKFDQTFKREAVNNWLASGKAAPAVATELGILPNRLYAWRQRFAPADPGGKAAAGAKPGSASELQTQREAARRERGKCHPAAGQRPKAAQSGSFPQSGEDRPRKGRKAPDRKPTPAGLSRGRKVFPELNDCIIRYVNIKNRPFPAKNLISEQGEDPVFARLEAGRCHTKRGQCRDAPGGLLCSPTSA